MKKFLQGSSSWCRSAQDFLSEMEKNDYAPATITTYKLHLSRLVPLVNGKTIKDVKGHDLNAAITKLRTMYPGSYQRPGSVNVLKNCCKAFFKWKSSCCRSENPAAFIRTRGVISETMPIMPQEIQQLLETIRTSEDFYKKRDEALFATYACTGLRRAEALTLGMADYQREKALLKVVSKGGGNRWIPVIKPLKAILDRYLDNKNRQSKTWFLFTGRSNTRALSCRQANNRFVKWRKISGLPEYLTIHSFRAGFATELYRQTGDLLLTCKALGHCDIKSTCRYIGGILNAKEQMERLYAGLF